MTRMSLAAGNQVSESPLCTVINAVVNDEVMKYEGLDNVGPWINVPSNKLAVRKMCSKAMAA